MKYIKEWLNFNQSIVDKVTSIVDKILSHQPGGKEFFDKIDDAIKSSKNKDITIGLFNKIYSKYGHNFNLALSGGYGKYVLDMINKNEIECKGTIVLFNGSITSHKNLMGTVIKNKDVNIDYKSDNIESKKFIFVDDSYYSGTTFKLILKFLQSKKSNIEFTYVIYDGNDTKSPKRESLYRYYDNHKGRSLDVEILINKLNKIKDAPTDIIKPLIIKGNITTNRELIDCLNKTWSKLGVNKYIDPKDFNFSNQL